MLSSNPIITETLALLLHHGVRDIVLCPGSRDAGIVHSVCQIPEFRTHTATDERCAGFMAIGMADATDRAVAVVVTSGSALANLHPAACEAYYRQVPVVFISADRPGAWIGQMDGQTMPQAGALGRMVRMCADLPEDNLWHANRLLNEAMLCCTARQPRGPVHINLPVGEPIYEFTTEHLPETRVIRLRNCTRECSAALSHSCIDYAPEGGTFAHGHTIILCGQMAPEEVPDNDILSRISRQFTIIAESLSNIPPQYYVNPVLIDWAEMEPAERVITLGGHMISKELKRFFRTHRPAEHWHVSTDGAVADLFCCQTMAVQATATEFLHDLMEYGCPQCRPAMPPMTEAEPTDYRTELLETFFSLLPEDVAVHLANSSTVRLAQAAMDRWRRHTAQACAPVILCNRGINGIEGSLSTAVGYALARPERQTYVITGDLAFFYDRNALWTSPLPSNLHILLLNDGGGSIFHTLPLPSAPASSRQAIMGTHGLSASHTALQHGLIYLRGTEQLETFVHTKETSLLEIILYDETMEDR